MKRLAVFILVFLVGFSCVHAQSKEKADTGDAFLGVWHYDSYLGESDKHPPFDVKKPSILIISRLDAVFHVLVLNLEKVASWDRSELKVGLFVLKDGELFESTKDGTFWLFINKNGYLDYRGPGLDMGYDYKKAKLEDYRELIESAQIKVDPQKLQFGRINSDNVRYRSSPNIGDNIRGSFDTGERCEILDKTATKQKIGDMEAYWYKVRIGDGNWYGWVYGAYLDIY
jgi:hypothetical protein